MAEAVTFQCGEVYDWTADGAYTKGDVIQLPSGRAGVVLQDVTSGNVVGVDHTPGTVYEVAKTTSMVFLAGGRVFWDYSANKAHYKKVNDRDFYLGRALVDTASAATTIRVQMNTNPPDDIDALGGDGGYLSVATGTQAVGGFGPPQVFGKSKALTLTATSEVQCVDILSVDKFDKAANAIVEVIFRLGTNGSTSAVDINFGMANGTSASDADAITEHVLFHLDGGTLTILAQSKDGTTTVAATTTGVSATAAAAVADRFECWIDTRNPANVLLYVNGAAVATGSTFKIDAATGPFGLLAHLEKSTGTATAGPIYVDRLSARFSQI